jgi:hypothetical protein
LKGIIMAGTIIKSYGTILKGMPLQSGPQTAGKPKTQGNPTYPNGSSKKSKK